MADLLAFPLLRFLMYALALYRLTALVVHDEGPGDIFLRLRDSLGAYNYGADGRPETWHGRLISCPYCVGVYLGSLGFVLLLLNLEPVNWFMAWWAMLGLMAWLEGSSGRGVL